jgi:hypothetical protein
MGGAAFDEMTGLSDGRGPNGVRSAYDQLTVWLDSTPPDVFERP